MNILAILYWVLLVVGLVFLFIPTPGYVYSWRAFAPSLLWVALFIIIGLKVFRTPLN